MDYIDLSPDLMTKYNILGEIGRGGFSIVYEAISRIDGTRYAVKTIYKRYVSRKGWVNLQREIEILRSVKHPNVLSLIEYFESESQIDLVLEFMTGGELFEQIVQRGNFSERDASTIIEQVLQGLAYLHSMGVAHRDLKPVVVADFGLAKNFGRGELLQTHCGTPSYAAPEVVRGDDVYDKAVDLWSVGVITYVLLAGFFPFYDEDNDDLREKIISGKYEFVSPYWDKISPQGELSVFTYVTVQPSTHYNITSKDFVSQLLLLDPTKRFTAVQALQHPWIKQHAVFDCDINLKESIDTFRTQQRRLKDSANY
ncbi:hypothetical protein PROFUN_04624 [Planoprotostelium fungivorum]|uniref:non-specific serine/threonine protein kinase n=1 Tax=Planoprotostelium fungivorum TaxID=1890364 RepID=A0A2P6NUF2_9EUKA|nr:hypothetical protein PROFUN_04624 [Planoprotostelium fungivorum]